MTLKDIVYDIKTLLRQVTDDTSVSDVFLVHKINNYREILANAYYQQYKVLDPALFQRLGVLDTTDVLSSDHPAIGYGSVRFSKVSLPKLMSIPDAMTVQVSEVSRLKILTEVSLPYLLEVIKNKDYRLKIWHLYFREDDAINIYPTIKKVAVSAALSDPRDGYKFKTEYGNLAALTSNNQYTVLSGSVRENIASTQNIYVKGDTFTTDANGTYSGDGKVKLTTQYSAVSMSDDYPISREMAQEIVIQILTRDYQIERQQIFDTFNDAMDQLKVIAKNVG